jgi:hypothetical protein
MGYISTTVPNGIDRNANSPQRVRRTMQRLSQGAATPTIKVADPLSNTGIIALTLATNSGLHIVSHGLALFLADTSLLLGSGGVQVKLADTSLTTVAGGVEVRLDTNSGLGFRASPSGLTVLGHRTETSDSPLAADSQAVYNSTTGTFRVQGGGLKGTLEENLTSITADSTAISNTGATTTFSNGSLTLPANFLTAGTVLRLTGVGRFGTTGLAVGMTWRLQIGSTTILDVVATNAVSISSGAWQVTFLLTVRTAGSGGTVEAFGEAVSPGITVAVNTTGTSPVSINTTGSLAVNLQFTWGTSNSSNTITLEQLTIERLN